MLVPTKVITFQQLSKQNHGLAYHKDFLILLVSRGQVLNLGFQKLVFHTLKRTIKLFDKGGDLQTCKLIP